MLSVMDGVRAATLSIDDICTASAAWAQDTSISASSALPSLPSDCTRVLVSVTGDSVRWKPNDLVPTASAGMLIPENSTVLFMGSNAELAKLHFIEVAASAQIDCLYLK